VGFEGSLIEFFEFINTDEQFFYPNTDQGRQAYLDDSKAFLDAITEQLPQYFGILPQAELQVKRVEAFREQDGAPQHYSPGTPDGSRKGTYYAHLSDMRAMPKSIFRPFYEIHIHLSFVFGLYFPPINAVKIVFDKLVRCS
jgi:uncharacterized protein (DUF885 family)